MIKNIIITILSILAILFWLSEEPDEVSDDPNDVTIEYQCNELYKYEYVPPEVTEECKSRGFSVKNTV